jgi:AcrR family transcriptional regulator
MNSTTAERSHAPRLRADASRNRERIVAAAREVFVEDGAEASIDEIARRAGVGNATVYRHFADRRELIRQVTLEVMDRILGRAETALVEAPDAYEALRRFVHGAADERIGALCPLLSAAGGSKAAAEFAEKRGRLEAVLEDMMERGRRDGLLRPDAGVGDIMVALAQLTRPLPGTACLAIDRFAHRHLELFLDGLGAPARSELQGNAATFEDLRRS